MLKTSIQSEKAFFLCNVNSETMNNLEIIHMSFLKVILQIWKARVFDIKAVGGFPDSSDDAISIEQKKERHAMSCQDVSPVQA